MSNLFYNALRVILLFFCTVLNAQDCNSLYLINAQNGNIYNISSLNGNLGSVVATMPNGGRSNLAVGADPSNTSNTVFTTSNTESGSTVYKAGGSIGTTLPLAVGGLTTNPTTGSTFGYVYGISNTRHLIKASPAPATDLGLITGDATWSSATVSNDAFFDNIGRMYVVATASTGTKYLYKINISTLTAESFLGLSGSLPSNFQGLSFYNGNIYAVEGYSSSILLVSWFNARVYEINTNTGIGTVKTTYQLNTYLGPFSSSDNLDLASCAVFTPPTTPSCNELFGVDGTTQSVYRINSDLTTTVVAQGTQTNQGNMAYGPIPGNLNTNQFVTSRNQNNGTIYKGTPTGAGITALTASGDVWNGSTSTTAPVGIGTDPSSGIVYGIYNKKLSKYTNSGDATQLADITGDTNWNNGTTLNDIAVDNGGNLYCIISNGANNVWLYRVNPNTSAATPVVKVTGTYPTDLNSTNGNGLAYMGDYFYYSRHGGTGNTTIWKLDAMTGVSSLVGSVNNIQFGDLGSCATVTNVPSVFAFNCSASTAGLQGSTLLVNGTAQANVLRVPITGAINGLAEFTISGSGFSTSPSPYIAFVAQGATFVDIPINFDGSGPVGNRTITVTSPRATGSCSITVTTESTYCYKEPITTTVKNQPVKHGITSLNRAGSGSTEWPTVRQGAWTVLEAKTKGFVINRTSFVDEDGNPATPPTPPTSAIPAANYVEGMVMYDNVAHCMKVYTGAANGWQCYNTQACPDF